MPTDIPVSADLPQSAHALFHAESHAVSAPAILQAGLAAPAVAATPGKFTIKKGENLARRAGVVSTSKTVTFTIPMGAVPNLTSTCFTFDLKTLGLTSTLDPKWKFVEQAAITVHSDTVALFNATSSCLVLKDKPNINWRPGTKPVTVKVALNKPFLDALRAAGSGDISFALTVAGYVAPPSPPPSSSSDDDK